MISPQTVDTGAAALFVTVGDSESDAGAACDTVTENVSKEQIKNEKRAMFRSQSEIKLENDFDALKWIKRRTKGRASSSTAREGPPFQVSHAYAKEYAYSRAA